jgi:hypothetical protein
MLKLLRHPYPSQVFLAKAMHDTSSFTSGLDSNTFPRKLGMKHLGGLGKWEECAACTMGVDVGMAVPE